MRPVAAVSRREMKDERDDLDTVTVGKTKSPALHNEDLGRRRSRSGSPDPWGSQHSTKYRRVIGMGKSTESVDHVAEQSVLVQNRKLSRLQGRTPQQHSHEKVREEPERHFVGPVFRDFYKHIWSNPPSDSSNASVPMIPGSRRWRFNNSPPRTREAMDAVKEELLEQLCRHSTRIKTAQLLMFFPSDGEHVCVEVNFRTYKAYKDAEDADLRWKNVRMDLISSEPFTAQRKTILNIRSVARTRAVDLFAHLQEKLDSHVTFHNLWATYKGYECESGYKRLTTDIKFSGTLIIQVKYRQGNGPEDLPGYIRDEHSNELRLNFDQRGIRCTFCKSRARDVHTFAECRRKKCSRCRGEGHVASECPTRRRGENMLIRL